MQEKWLDIKNYKNYYQISSWGRVKSLKHWKSPRLLLTQSKRYPKVTLTKNQERQHFNIHRLVADAFIANPMKKPHVHHKHGIKNDNKVENLEWITPSENEFNSYTLGKVAHCRGSNHHFAKLDETQVRKIKNALKKYKRGLGKKLAEQYGIQKTIISKIKNNKIWLHVHI